jgi:hypothetical protein
MNPYLQFYIECLKVYEGKRRRLTPEERRAHFVVITGGKKAA